MSKLYSNYLKLKNQDVEKIYLFKSGIFYIALDEDAKKLSEMFSFKLTKLNENIVKCGFPDKRLDFYINQLNLSKIPFEIIDSNYSTINNYSDYINNKKIQKVMNSIITIDMNNITFKDTFEFLEKINNELKTLYPNGI